MKNPDQFLLLAEGAPLPQPCFSNLDWGKDEALRRAQELGVSQTIYKLVPVHAVEVRVTREQIIKDLTEK
jgi:hypothetical protein